MIRAKLVYNVQQMYQNYSNLHGERALRGRPYQVPLAIQFHFAFGADKAGGADLCFLLDRSQSMTQSPGAGWDKVTSRWEAVRETLKQMATTLRPADRVALVAFDHRVQPVRGGQFLPAAELGALIDELPPPETGATDIAGALREGARVLQAVPRTDDKGERPAAVVLLTDGHAYMGKTPAVDPRKDALNATAVLQEAGIDLATLGFGDEWDEVLLKALDSRIGKHGVRYIDSPTQARAAFVEVTRQQEDSVLQNVRLEGDLNIDHFTWESVWQLLPNRSAQAPILYKKEGPAPAPGGPRTARWSHPLGNVRHGLQAKYTLMLTARPLPPLEPRTYTVGSFMLYAGQQRQPLMETPHKVELRVVDGEVKVEVRADASSPQNPLDPVETNWLLAQITDLKDRLNNLIRSRDKDKEKEAMRIWDIILDYHRRAENNTELRQEEAAREVYLREHNLKPKVILEYTHRATTVSSPVSDMIADNAFREQGGITVVDIDPRRGAKVLKNTEELGVVILGSPSHRRS